MKLMAVTEFDKLLVFVLSPDRPSECGMRLPITV